MTEQAKILFYDGQRVRREDLDYLQDNLLQGLQHLRLALGIAGVSWGYRVTGIDSTHMAVGSGLAFDQWARPIILSEPATLEIVFSGENSIYLCAQYKAEVAEEINGQPVKVEHSINLSFKNQLPQSHEDDIPIAQIRPREGGFDVIQKGQWYLPPLNAGHTGNFFEDDAGRWRYDGDPVVSRLHPHFDSGWVTVSAKNDQNLAHNLRSLDLLVQLQNQPFAGTVSSLGLGSEFWYELHDENVIRLFNNKGSDLKLRALLWRVGEKSAETLNPVADAGTDVHSEYGHSFVLDGSDSMAFEGRSVVRYVWTLVD